MLEKVIEPISIERKVPFADEFRRLADDIATSLRISLDADDITDIEAAGRQALAAMLALYADGDLPPKQAFTFLKSLAERKTPDPVQKVEQTTQVDMRVLVQGLITDNPAALQSALDRASEARREIAARLQNDAPLQLSSPTVDGGVSLTLKEPDEVQNIRTGHDTTDDWQRFRNIP
jgi:hypothetical protein